MQHNFPCNTCAKNEYYESCSNNNSDSETRATSKLYKNSQQKPNCEIGIVWPQLIRILCISVIPMTMCYHTHKGNGQLSKPKYHFLHTYNLGSTVFAWSILSWIMHRNSSFNCINSILQVWYNFLYDFWCKICFLSFASYFRASLLFFPNLDIKSFRYSHIVHFTNTNPHLGTSTFRWCLFFNLLIANWEIPPMFNSLFICQLTN